MSVHTAVTTLPACIGPCVKPRMDSLSTASFRPVPKSWSGVWRCPWAIYTAVAGLYLSMESSRHFCSMLLTRPLCWGPGQGGAVQPNPSHRAPIYSGHSGAISAFFMSPEWCKGGELPHSDRRVPMWLQCSMGHSWLSRVGGMVHPIC